MSDILNARETSIATDWVGDVDELSAHTGDPGATGSNNEVGAADYERANVSGDWQQAGNQPVTIDNANEIQFATAENDWGTIEYVVAWDATGSEMGKHELVDDTGTADPVTINEGDRLIFETNDIGFEID